MKIIVLENADKIGKGKKYHLENNLNEFAQKKKFYFCKFGLLLSFAFLEIFIFLIEK